jgi:tetratricopeptide (TPR) repeat protein
VNRSTWIVGVGLCLVACACSEAPKKKPGPVAVAGPAAPELGWRETSERAERAPISLTASDGTGLELVSLHARVVIDDPLAFTELHLAFRNPEPRRREGRFEIVLPERAAVSRFAMRVGDRLQEGEVVERRRAQQVYEDFLHRKQDPALLEKDAGNELSMRVFPIEASSDKEIILAYSEERVRSDEPYRLLLSGLPALRDIKVDVRVGSSSGSGRSSDQRAQDSVAQLKLYDTDFTPQGDLEVRVPWKKAVALRSGELVLARVAPIVERAAAPIDGLTVLFDTSASRALGYGAQVERLDALIAQLRQRAGDFDLRVIAFDQDAQEIHAGPASAFGTPAHDALLARGALGATDLGPALALAAQGSARHARVLLVGDGVVTAGADDTTNLREAVAKLAAHGAQRMDVLGEGGIRDAETLGSLASAGLAQSGVVLDARDPVAVITDKLLTATAARIEVQVAGASWVHPAVLTSVQPGDERLLFVELPAGTPLQIELVGAGIAAPQLQEVPRPLLERAWARASIEAKTGELRALPKGAGEVRQALERRIVELSVAQRVVSDFTALLVLETEADYARFAIPRSGRAEILRVGEEGIELVERAELEREQERDRLKVAKKDGEGAFQQRDEANEAPIDDFVEPPTTGDLAAPRAVAQGATRGADEHRAEAKSSAGESLGGLARAKGESRSLDTTTPTERSRRAAAQPEAFAPPPPAKVASAPGGPMREAEAARPAPASPSTPAAAPKPAAESSLRATRGAAQEPDSLLADDQGVGSIGTGRGAGGLGTRAGSGAADAASLARRESPSLEEPLQLATEPRMAARAVVRLHGASGVPAEEAARVLRSALAARARACYDRASKYGERDRFSFELVLSDKGTVADAYATGGSLADPGAQSCVLAAARALRFPKPENGRASVTGGVELSFAPVQVRDPNSRVAPRPRAVSIAQPSIADAYEGVLGEVLEALRNADTTRALERATLAHADNPGDVIALVALGEALEARQDYGRAARAYGSLIDLYPSRADLRRMAGERLERLPEAGLALAVDTYRRAVLQRPDHPSGPRLLAYALLRSGDHAAAFAALESALSRGYAEDRFEGVPRILREDLALVGAAWSRAEPAAQERVTRALSSLGLTLDKKPSTRFVLSWETDANDVDFHVYDGRGGHAYYMKPRLASGGSLYADITTGYGPECFAIPGRASAHPYVLQAHYFARGPMGFGMGTLQVVEHDGQGGLRFEQHPFVIMKDKAFVELARLAKPASKD